MIRASGRGLMLSIPPEQLQLIPRVRSRHPPPVDRLSLGFPRPPAGQQWTEPPERGLVRRLAAAGRTVIHVGPPRRSRPSPGVFVAPPGPSLAYARILRGLTPNVNACILRS